MSIRATTAAAAAAFLLGASSAPAQIGPGPDNPAAPRRPITAHEDDTSYGWVGVFGVLGLLGLVGARNRTTRREHDFMGGRSTAKTRTQS